MKIPACMEKPPRLPVVIPAQAGIQSPADNIRVRRATCPNESDKVGKRRLILIPLDDNIHS